MKNVLGWMLAVALTGATAHAEDRMTWISKPVLCGDTEDILTEMTKTGFVPYAKSSIVIGEEERNVGILWLMVKDDEMIHIESFRHTSCIINVTKSFVILKSDDKKNVQTF